MVKTVLIQKKILKILNKVFKALLKEIKVRPRIDSTLFIIL